MVLDKMTIHLVTTVVISLLAAANICSVALRILPSGGYSKIEFRREHLSKQVFVSV